MDPVTLALAGPQISAKSTSHQDLHLSYLHWLDNTNNVSKNNNEERFVDSDNNSRDDYHTYHGVAR
jgi:hypothetical protein